MNDDSIFSTEALDAHGNPFKVLIVDDSAVCRNALKKCLEQYGFHVIALSDSREVVTGAKRERPTIILTDVQMPEMDGFDVCIAVKDDPETKDIPVLFVTSDDRPEHKLCGFEAGGADFIAKGADTLEVIARVRTHVRIASLQNELRDKLNAIQEHAERERELRQQIEAQQTQMLQNEKMASIGQLAAGVAHEINNPIGFISSNLNTLAEYAGDIKDAVGALLGVHESLRDRSPGVREKWEAADGVIERVDLQFLLDDLTDVVTESVDGADRVRQIVADLKDFSHVDTPDLTVEDINVLIERTLNVAHNETKYKAEVKTEFGDLPPVPCYGGKLAQVVLNLVVNAAQAIEDHGTITVASGTAGRNVWIEVRDTGCGIPEENLKRIFDPFFTTKDVGKGTGLGLHLAYQIIQSHEGRITARSTVGEGTTFRIEIPKEGPSDANTCPEPENAIDQAA